jgi:hypothetical protein
MSGAAGRETVLVLGSPMPLDDCFAPVDATSSSGRAVRAPALARHRRVRGVTLTRLPDSVRCHVPVANSARMQLHLPHPPWRPPLLVRQHRAAAASDPKHRPRKRSFVGRAVRVSVPSPSTGELEA